MPLTDRRTAPGQGWQSPSSVKRCRITTRRTAHDASAPCARPHPVIPLGPLAQAHDCLCARTRSLMRPCKTARRKSATRSAECAWAFDRTRMSGPAGAVACPTEVRDPSMRRRKIAPAHPHLLLGGFPRPAHPIPKTRASNFQDPRIQFRDRAPRNIDPMDARRRRRLRAESRLDSTLPICRYRKRTDTSAAKRRRSTGSARCAPGARRSLRRARCGS